MTRHPFTVLPFDLALGRPDELQACVLILSPPVDWPISYCEHHHGHMTWCGPLQKFYNEQALLQCASARIPVAFNADSDINNDEWQTTLQLISQQAAQLSGSQAGTVSSESLG